LFREVRQHRRAAAGRERWHQQPAPPGPVEGVRPDLQIHPLRGNVDTRLRKLESGDYDAIILAAAGLNRLGKTQLVRQVIPAEVMTPAAGQGALGIEIRNGDKATRALLAFLDDAAARATTTCERACSTNSAAAARFPSEPSPK
jgi:hydroxymethylbilane synthase